MSDRPKSNSKLLTPDSSLISQKPTCYQPVITASCDPTAEEVTETSNETKMNRETVKERIAEVRMSDPESLRRTYRELIGVDAATFGSQFLQRRCVHRLQEMAFGGLTSEELDTLDYIARHDPTVNRELRSAPRSAQDTRGVIFRREYRGRIYEMRSLGNGRYEYDQKIYTSPTAVVRAITGKSHYNGVLWWGLRKNNDQRKD